MILVIMNMKHIQGVLIVHIREFQNHLYYAPWPHAIRISSSNYAQA